ncbi:MAG TPA: hypothetical protein VJZ77_05920 [Blastocatellia bacterium]|nr:hypothetical protein [Blastocatellia bacterium]
MAQRTTISDLRARVRELEEENQSLSETLDEVYNLVAPESEEGEGDGDDEEE